MWLPPVPKPILGPPPPPLPRSRAAPGVVVEDLHAVKHEVVVEDEAVVAEAQLL